MPVPADELDAGLRAHQTGRLSEARHIYERVLQKTPDHGYALFLYGTLLTNLGEFARAISVLRKCVALQPGVAVAHNSLGNALLKLGDAVAAEQAYRSAAGCQPPSPEALTNLGFLLRTQGRLPEAISLYEQALQLNPGSVETLCNLAVALRAMNRCDDALAALARARTLAPGRPEIPFNEALIHLVMGNLPEGWRGHEFRWQTEQRGALRNFGVPQWTGDVPLAGRQILVHAEQGLGDTLQFVRYVPLMIAQGARVHLEAQPPLLDLLAGIQGLASLLPQGSPPPPGIDFHCPLLSLPLAFKTNLGTIPSRTPYLEAPRARLLLWEERLAGMHRPRVGFVWFGNRRHKNDRNRSLPPAIAAELLAHSPLPLVCLQKGIQAPADAALLESGKLLRLSDDIRDFSDTAAIIHQLDLVISVDTSVAHLAGALGKPLWLLLPFSPDWRWLLDRSDTPWYPGARLYRQRQPDDWSNVVDDVVRDLDALCPANGPGPQNREASGRNPPDRFSKNHD